MKKSLAGITLIIGFTGLPLAAAAALALAPIMRDWNHARREIDAMLAGNTPYDAAVLRRAAALYVRNADAVAAATKERSAAARDFAERMRNFAADSAAAGAVAASPADFRGRYARVMADCRSCHAIYNN